MKGAMGVQCFRKGSGQGCAGEGTSLSGSEGTALLRGSCWSWHSFRVFPGTPQAFPSFMAGSCLCSATGLCYLLLPFFLELCVWIFCGLELPASRQPMVGCACVFLCPWVCRMLWECEGGWFSPGFLISLASHFSRFLPPFSFLPPVCLPVCSRAPLTACY